MKRSRLNLLVSLGIACLIGTASLPVYAYCLNPPSSSGNYYKWGASPVTYRVSDNLTDAKILKAIDDAFAAWGSVSCSTLSFTKGASFKIDSLNPTNHNQKAILVFWYTTSTGFPAATGNVYFTNMGFDGVDDIVMASISINGFDYNWSTDGASSTLDAQSIVTSSIGRVIGLKEDKAHSGDSVIGGAIQFADTSGRTLGKDDINGLHYLYNANNCPAEPTIGSNHCSTGIVTDGGVTDTGTDAGTDVGTDAGTDAGVTDQTVETDHGQTDQGQTDTTNDTAQTDQGNTSDGNNTDFAVPDSGDDASSSDSAISKDSSGQQCSSNEQCATNEVCTIHGVCERITIGCVSHDDCADGEVCTVDGKCLKSDGGCAVGSGNRNSGLMITVALVLLALGLFGRNSSRDSKKDSR